MVEFVSVYPPLDADDKRCNKFPFVAAELFACDSGEFLDKILDLPPLLDQLFAFFRRLPLDLTLAGYVSKAILALAKRNESVMFKSMSEENLFPLFLANLQVPSVTDIVAALLSINNSESFMPQRIYLLQSVVNALSSPRCASSAFTLISGLPFPSICRKLC